MFCLKGILSTCQNQTLWLVCSNCFADSSRNLSFHRNCLLDLKQLLVSLNITSLSVLLHYSLFYCSFSQKWTPRRCSKLFWSFCWTSYLPATGMAANPYGTCSSKCESDSSTTRTLMGGVQQTCACRNIYTETGAISNGGYFEQRIQMYWASNVDTCYVQNSPTSLACFSRS